MASQTNRRALLGTAILAPVAAACSASAVTAASGGDGRWRSLVAYYPAKHAEWFAAIDAQDQASTAFHQACASLQLEPRMPRLANDSLLDETARQIRYAGDAAEYAC